MLDYFVRYTAARERSLQRASIPFGKFQIGSENGLLFEERHLSKALEAFRSAIKQDVGSSYDGIRVLHLRRRKNSARAAAPPPTPAIVTVESWSAKFSAPDAGVFEGVSREFSALLGVREIVLVNIGSGDTPHSPRMETGKFHIFFWSAASGQAHDGNPGFNGRSTANNLWDYKICSDRGYWRVWWSSGQGVVITDDAGAEVAELIGENLYILYPITNIHMREGANVFRRILDEVVLLKTGTEEEKAARARVIAESRRARMRDAYVQACNRRLEKVIQDSRTVIEKNPEKVHEHQQAIVNLIREAKEANERIRLAEGSETEARAAYAREFDKLLKVPNVRDVHVRDDAVHVFTDTLYCVDPRSGKRHEIGAFRIEMHLDDHRVRWFNLTRIVDGYEAKMNAPHIFGNGRACLGNMAEVIPQLMANYEFAALAMVAIQFVESVNADDSAGRHIGRWPIADGKEEKS